MDKEKHNARIRKWRSENKDKVAAQNRRSAFKQYGITQEDYDRFLQHQNYCCAICRSPDTKGRKNWCIDHDHRTGKVRGLLCVQCNVLLGNANDSVETLGRAIRYLKDSQ